MELTLMLFWAAVYGVMLPIFPAASTQPNCHRNSSLCSSSVCCCYRPKNPNIIAVDCTRRNLTEVPLDLPANTVEINLSFNNLTALPADAFGHVTKLQHLKLVGNRIRTLNKDVFRGLEDLHSLDLQLNLFQTPPSKAFHPDLANLRALNLNSNYIEDFPGHALLNLHSLRHLSVEGNRLNRIPTEAISLVPELTVLLLSSNAITMVQDHAFQNNTKLTELSLNNNSIQLISTHAFSGLYNLKELDFRYNYHRIKNIKQGAFRNLTNLHALAISDVDNLSEFPDLFGTTNLESLSIDRCSLTSIPAAFCNGMQNLLQLDLHNNKIESIPSFSNCSKLQILNLNLNSLSSLDGTPFKGLSQLSHLYLRENGIERIRADSFEGLSTAYELDLGKNAIIEIDEKAFLPLKQLETLHLDGNRFPALPTAGLDRLLKIYTFDNIHLESFPKPSELPKIIKIVSSYAYHCCSYNSLNEENSVKKAPEITEVYTWPASSYDYPGGNESSSWSEDLLDIFVEPHYNNSVHFRNPSNISCSPSPGPFLPCVDLFGSWFLRIGVYFVFLLAVVGNAIVIFVILVSHTKMDVPRFLICNLAFADFFLGVYLGFLAGVDTSTLGVFHKYGAQWQLSPGCSLAGFLAVFSSEFSIYTLSVITLERFYAIKHALHLEKRMKLPHAVAVMAFGWIFAVVVAVMPLVHVSSYYKFPVCLPLDVTTTIGKVYGSSILLLNVTAFVIIMLCYANIYMAIQGSHAWNCNDSRVARRMSLLVFTDFACWAPIAFFSLTSAFGLRLISLEGAKVLTIFVLPLNSCANPFLYTILTKQFKKDCKMIMRSLRNQVFRQRSMSRSITLSLGRHPSMRSTQAHQISQLRWRTNGSISQDITGDGCMVSSFKTENGEPSSSVYTVSTVAETHTPRQSNGCCANDHSHSDSSAVLDPMLQTNSDLDDLRRGSTSPLLDLMTQVTSKVPEAKPKSKVRRKFSIPFPFFSTHSPKKDPTHSSSARASMRRSSPPQRQKRSHSITEGLLHKMNRKRPLTSMKSAPGIASTISRSTEKLDQAINGVSIGICINIPDKWSQDKNKAVEQTEVDEKVFSIDVPKEPPKPPLSNFPIDPASMETQGLLEVGGSNSCSPENRSSHETETTRMLTAHENPVRDQLSSAAPSPQLHRPEKLELDEPAVPADKDVPDNDSGLGTASSPLPDSMESMRFLPVSLETPEVVCNSELDDRSSRATSQPTVLGGLFGHLTRSEPSRCYNEIPDSPTKASKEICRPKESVV